MVTLDDVIDAMERCSIEMHEAECGLLFKKSCRGDKTMN